MISWAVIDKGSEAYITNVITAPSAYVPLGLGEESTLLYFWALIVVNSTIPSYLSTSSPAPQRDQLLQVTRGVDADKSKVSTNVTATARECGLQPRLLPLHRRRRHLLCAHMHALFVGLLANTANGAGKGKYALLKLQPVHCCNHKRASQVFLPRPSSAIDGCTGCSMPAYGERASM